MHKLDLDKKYMKQERIPVECVPSAAVAVSEGCLSMGGGWCLPRGFLPVGCVCPG